jgi:hypothetical protein
LGTVGALKLPEGLAGDLGAAAGRLGLEAGPLTLPIEARFGFAQGSETWWGVPAGTLG